LTKSREESNLRIGNTIKTWSSYFSCHFDPRDVLGINSGRNPAHHIPLRFIVADAPRNDKLKITKVEMSKKRRGTDMQEKIFEAIHKRVAEEPYARKLGMKLLKVETGYSLVQMTFTRDMENIYGMAHGGAIFSLIDEAFETASNSHDRVAVALNLSVNFIKSPSLGAVLYAEARETSLSNRIGTYEIEVRDEQKYLIAQCQAMVYRKNDKLPFLD
jgi:acyl-CoA thioesterase